jgi:hypothetical protein
MTAASLGAAAVPGATVGRKLAAVLGAAALGAKALGLGRAALGVAAFGAAEFIVYTELWGGGGHMDVIFKNSNTFSNKL